jgi:hypothetical protein
MRKKLNTKTQNGRVAKNSVFLKIESKLIAIISSNKFLIVVIILFVLQSLWIALSFRYPMLFDERYHFEVIKIFSKQVSPIITNQPSSYDFYGNLQYGSASIYHYLISFPYRLIVVFTNSETVQIIILRIMNVLMVASGFWVYAKLFGEIGIKQVFINLSLLFYSLIPLVIFVTATISYDNMIFLLTPWFLLIGVQIIKSKNVQPILLSQFVLIGMFASLVKFTFLPVFAGGLAFIMIIYLRRYKSSQVYQVLNSLRSLSNISKILIIGVTIIIGGLFTAKYLVPTLTYGSPLPDCGNTLGIERCMSGEVYLNEFNAKKTKFERPVESLNLYILTWTKSILLQLDTSSAVTPNGILVGTAMPVLTLLMSFWIYSGIIALLLSWKQINQGLDWVFLMTISILLISATFIFNAKSYYNAHLDINTQTRYLLSVVPIIIVMSVVAVNQVLGRKRHIKTIVFISTLVLSTQGGGVIKPIVNSNENWFWQNNELIKSNKILKDTLAPMVIEN